MKPVRDLEKLIQNVSHLNQYDSQNFRSYHSRNSGRHCRQLVYGLPVFSIRHAVCSIIYQFHQYKMINFLCGHLEEMLRVLSNAVKKEMLIVRRR